LQDQGSQGENIAVDYLLSQGYKIQKRNYASRQGEIDIIAWDKEVLAFIEVKYYKINSLRDLHEAVDRRKQLKIIKTAEKYLYSKGLEDKVTRFDVVLVSCDDNNKVCSIELFKDAFRYN
jgi:putative endonuclease